MRRDDACLHDILESGRTIQRHLSGFSRNAFLANTEKQDSVYCRFGIMGEAARHLSPEALKALGDIPWRLITGMWNILIHNYGEVDAAWVWKTAQDDLPGLIQRLERYFRERTAQPPAV
jgi:uncharacterized protein with HEPN domain